MKQAHRQVQKYGTIQFETLIYIGDCLTDYIGEEISLRYDPRNIVTLLAYTAPQKGETSEFIGVIKARHFEYEQMTFEELKWIVQKLRKQWKIPDNISILNERYNKLNFIEEKRTEKRTRRKKAQQKRDKATNQSKIIEIFPQNLPQSELNAEEKATKASLMGILPKTRVVNQPLSPKNNPRVKRRNSGIVDNNIQDWNEYKQNNW